MRDSAKFSTHRVSKQCNLCNFQKIFPSPKMAAILNFRIFAKNGKTQIASISLTVRDRAISWKFSTHRVSKECNICNFQKIFPSPKMAAILNFRIFAKNGLCPPPWGVDILFLLFSPSDVRCPASRMVSAHLKEKY